MEAWPDFGRNRNVTVEHTHVCPWWVGYILINPLRRLLQNPDKITGSFVREGMTVLEIGPGMGFFTLPLARRAGTSGRVIAVELQERMLRSLRKRSKRAGLIGRIDCRKASESSLNIGDLDQEVDFAFAMAVIHEISDKRRLFREIYAVMRPAGTVLMADPCTRFPKKEFEKSIKVAEDIGFVGRPGPKVWHSWCALLVRTC
jgi:SAM-dependent methyltransferase